MNALTEVMTVTGPVRPEQLGLTITHEHLLSNIHHFTRNVNAMLEDEELAVREASLFKQAGGGTMVDVTNIGLYRKPDAIQRIAKAVGLNVVMGCGWYRSPFYPPDVDRRSVNSLADEMIRDIEVGAAQTGVRAGIIGEIGNDHDYIAGVEERVFRAAARAHLHTGLTITTHSCWYPTGLEQLALLKEEGVDPRRVIIGHCDTIPNPDYQDAIAASGAWVQFDRNSGKFPYETEQRIGWLRRLRDKDCLNRVLLSHDVCLQSDLHAYGGSGYDYIVTGLIPKLLEAGFNREKVDMLTIDNPRRALTGGE